MARKKAQENLGFMPHINGLRALAILAVVLYHLNEELCPCGYFGVDIFLLLTGYLLFSRDLSPARLPELRYGAYLLRKIWRLGPPVLVVGCPLALAGAWLLQPDLYEMLVQTLGYCALGLSNEYVARSGDYFNPATQDNPLMHFWYVGLTVQLYILIPLLALMMRHLNVWIRHAVLGCVGLCSLALSVFLQYGEDWPGMLPYVTPLLDIFPPYYSLFTRLWEPLLAMLLVPWCTLPKRPGWPAWAGMLLVLIPMYGLETGSACVYPVLLGAMLLLRYGQSGTMGRLLSWQPMQQLGSVSFSFYIVHWPIFALWDYVTFDKESVAGAVALFALSVLLAWLLWRGVESRCMQWFRSFSPRAAAWLLPVVLVPIAFLCALPVYCVEVQRALPNAMDEETMQYSHPILSGRATEEELQGFPRAAFQHTPLLEGSDKLAPVSFLLLGDSHAWHLHYGMDKCLRTRGGFRGLYLNNSCVPAWDCFMELQGGNARWNRQKGELLLKWLQSRPDIRCVIISNYWHLRFCMGSLRNWNLRRIPREDIRTHLENGLLETCRRLTMMGKKVIVVRDTPFWPRSTNHVNRFLRHELLGLDYPLPEQTPAQHAAACATEEAFMRQVRESGFATCVSLSPALAVQGAYPLRREGKFLYRDTNHLSRYGSELAASLLLEHVGRILAPSSK